MSTAEGTEERPQSPIDPLPAPLPTHRRLGLDPLPCIALSSAGGIMAATYGGLLLLVPVSLFVVILLLCFLKRRMRLLGFGLVLAFFLLGAVRDLIARTSAPDTIAQLAPAEVTLTGVVQSDIETSTPDDPLRPPMAHCVFAVRRAEAVGTIRHRVGASGIVALNLPLGEARHGRLALCRPADLPRYGDIMTIHGRLEPPVGARNPGGFDASAFLARQEAEALCSVSHLADWHVVRPSAAVQPIQAAAYTLRQGVIRQMQAGLSQEHAAVMEGLLLGARGDLPGDLKDAFERTGAAHLLATAGLHVGLLVWLFLGLLRLLRLPRRPALLAVLALLPLYAMMTGDRPAVTRAVVVAELVLLGPLLEREPNLPNALSLAALILLLRDPNSLFDAGFQLSFATVITILLLLPPVEVAIQRLCDQVIRRRPRAVWLRKGLHTVVTAFFLAVIAQIGSAPLVAFHYHNLSLIAPLANAAIVPFAGLLLALGSLGAALGLLHPLLAWPVYRALDGLLTPVIAIVRACAAPSWADLPVVSPPFGLVCLYYSLVWGGACYIARRRAVIDRLKPAALSPSQRTGWRPLWSPMALLAAVVSLLWLGNAAATRGDGVLHVWFLDVGQGDATVLRTPSGRTFVIDAGSSDPDAGDDVGRRVVVPFLRHEGLGHIDALILTSPHGEQSGGAVTLLGKVDVGALIDVGQPAGPRLQTSILRAARDRGTPCKAAHADNTIDCGDGATLRFLALSGTRSQDLARGAGIVLRVDYGRTALLFMGDADSDVEAELLRGRQPLACDVLKVGRQGGADATSARLLAAAHPRFAVISVGQRNLNRDPSPEVLSRLNAGGAQVYRTDQSGAILCVSDGVTVQMQIH